MILAWIVFIALIVWAIARLFPALSGGDARRRETDAETPREILDRRLARGEIDTDEYARLRETLGPAQGARR
jgi:putative membrane protein